MADNIFSGKTSDAELVLLLKEDDKLAFTLLYKKYSGEIYINILKMVKEEQAAEEMIQVLFTKIWNQRATITYESDFAGYLYRSASNLVADFYRKITRERIMMAHLTTFGAEEYYTHVEENIYFQESNNLLKRALADLSPQQRNVYQLCKLDGYTYKETACRLGISQHTVKEYLSKARQCVQKFVEANVETISCLTIFLLFN